MAAVNYFLVVLGFCSLSSTYSTGFDTEECTTVLYGTKTSNPVPLPRTYLPSGYDHVSITIPQICHAKGVQVKVCDDKAPNVTIPSMWLVDVKRMGSLYYIAYADITVYCPDPYTPLIVPLNTKFESGLESEEV